MDRLKQGKVTFPKSVALRGEQLELGGFARFDQIHRDFGTTDLGAAMNNKTRYEKFQFSSTEPGKKVFEDQEWELLLGPDVNQLDHLLDTYMLTQWFLSQLEEPLDTDQQQKLLFAAITHDWPEGITGDVHYNDMTDAQANKEADIHLSLLIDMFGGANRNMLETVAEITKKTGETDLSAMFDTVEKIGYLITGLRAWEVAKDQPEGERTTRLQYLAGNVVANQVEALVSRFDDYQPVRLVLGAAKADLDEIFRELDTGLFEQEGDKNPKKATQDFENSKAAWQDLQDFLSIAQEIED